MSKIVFYGALGYPDKQVVGGGESGNLKTIGLLSRMGHKVVKVYKPYPSKGIIGSIFYILNLLLVLPKVFIKLMALPKSTIVHVSGFYMHLIYIECALILLVKLCGRKCIYELRGGGVQSAYDDGSSLYRCFFRKAVLSSDLLMSQGEKYVKFLENLGAKSIFYYPNYLQSENLSEGFVDERTNSVIPKLVYFGRLSESKNVNFIIDVVKELKDRSFSFQLDFIGTGDASYVSLIQRRIEELNLASNVNFLGSIFGRALFDSVMDKHFFVFPSKEPREGHSNSLTEAMALGVVPICSTAGFNKEIVNNDNLVIGIFDAVEYANRIISIWNDGLWYEYSNDLKARAKSKFSEEFVFQVLSKVYTSVSNTSKLEKYESSSF